jgi:hypothetical protein
MPAARILSRIRPIRAEYAAAEIGGTGNVELSSGVDGGPSAENLPRGATPPRAVSPVNINPPTDSPPRSCRRECTYRVRLKCETQTELNQAWSLRRRDLSECRGSEIAIRSVEVRVIENIEEIRPELQVSVFRDRKCFGVVS